MKKMTDREKIEYLADKLGVLEKVSRVSSYIANRRFFWNDSGELVQVIDYDTYNGLDLAGRFKGEGI